MKVRALREERVQHRVHGSHYGALAHVLPLVRRADSGLVISSREMFRPSVPYADVVRNTAGDCLPINQAVRVRSRRRLNTFTLAHLRLSSDRAEPGMTGGLESGRTENIASSSIASPIPPMR